MSEKKRVLILCTGNSARSQMVEGLLRHEAGDRFEVVSAGVERTYVRPEAVEAMREIGVDISNIVQSSSMSLRARIRLCNHCVRQG